MGVGDTYSKVLDHSIARGQVAPQRLHSRTDLDQPRRWDHPLRRTSRSSPMRTNMFATRMATISLAFLSTIAIASRLRVGLPSQDTQHLLSDQTSVIEAAGNSTPSAPLQCLQVVSPVVTPANNSEPCFLTIMEHSFGNSYGSPFVGEYYRTLSPFPR